MTEKNITILSLQQIQVGLKDRNLGIVSEQTGIERNRLGKIRKGAPGIERNIRQWEVEALSEYLR